MMSRAPITEDNCRDATVAGHHIMAGESTDWWLNPETYGKPLSEYPESKRPEVVHAGWLLEEGSERVEPDAGLFVHTVTPETEGEWYYAVRASGPEDEDGVAEASVIVPGDSSLTEPVSQQVAPVEPIWQGDPAAKPAVGSGEGLPLDVPLHAKRGRGGMDWLVFGDASLGWRDGLPFKFGSRVTEDAIQVSTTDRHWIARILDDARDGCNKLTPAIHTLWWGYNDHIYDPDLMTEGVCRGYAERRVLWMVDWAKQRFATDPMRTYAAGSSMGGCASFNIALRHPEVFAAIAPAVGIVTYRDGEGGNSSFRVAAYTGGLDIPTDDEGITVGERLDSTRFVLGATGDLPYMMVIHGRNDTSIPWWVNPDLYQAMQAGHHGCTMAWNDGQHGTAQRLVPADITQRKGWAWLHRFALDKSYPAFSNFSLDGDPGDGGIEDGDIEGYMNRGLDWDDPTDTADMYDVVIRYTLDAGDLPATVDVTPRRVQGFVLQPGEKVSATVATADSTAQIDDMTLTVDESGHVTCPGVRILAQGTRLTLTHMAQ
jgi:pimeloyl-ACP methyl ester carboxylesterase